MLSTILFLVAFAATLVASFAAGWMFGVCYYRKQYDRCRFEQATRRERGRP